MATLNPALRDFWATPARNRILYGGRASSKSWDAAGFAIFLASNYKARFLCCRQLQNKISESVYTLLKIQIERFGLEAQFKITDNSIKNIYTGSEFHFYGLWRHIEEIKSFEGVDVLWVEEGHALTEPQWDILEPTIRKENSQVWITFNPKSKTDFVYKRFVENPPPDTITRKINYDENLFLSDTLQSIIADTKETDYEKYRHVYLGETREDDGASKIISHAALERCKEAYSLWSEEVDTNIRHAGLDVAESEAGDKNAFAYRNGPVLHEVVRWKPEPELGPAPKAHLLAQTYGVTSLYFDAGGVGAGLKRDFVGKFEYGKTPPYDPKPFLFGGSVGGGDRPFIKGGKHNTILNKDYFALINIQVWWSLRMRVERTIKRLKGEDIPLDECLLINPAIADIDDLLNQLSQPIYKPNKQGKNSVDKYGEDGASPDMADAVIMAFSYDVRKGLRA